MHTMSDRIRIQNAVMDALDRGDWDAYRKLSHESLEAQIARLSAELARQQSLAYFVDVLVEDFASKCEMLHSRALSRLNSLPVQKFIPMPKPAPTTLTKPKKPKPTFMDDWDDD